MSGLNAKKWVSQGFLVSAGSCFLFGTAVTVGDVILRAVAARNIPGAIELTSLSVGLGALLSMPVCYTMRSHVTARLLSELLPNRFSHPLDLLGSVMSMVFAGLLLWVMTESAVSKLGSPETTADLGLSMPLAVSVVALALLASVIATVVGLRMALRHERSWQ